MFIQTVMIGLPESPRVEEEKNHNFSEYDYFLYWKNSNKKKSHGKKDCIFAKKVKIKEKF